MTTWRAKKRVEVVREEYGGQHWCVYATDSDYPIAMCGSEDDARYIAELWNARLAEEAPEDAIGG